MKTYFINKYKVHKKTLFVLCVFFITSCNEDEYLKEIPLDFYSPENSYVSSLNFEAATNSLYAEFRDEFHFENAQEAKLSPRITISGTDLMGYSQRNKTLNQVLIPASDFVYDAWWRPCYSIIYNANVIIGRTESENVELTAEEKVLYQAEARFFRGYMYMILADIYGGVPITLEETTEPKRDYTRATRNAVYTQCIEDLKFAAENLSGITDTEDSRISKLVAWHYLAEAYISMEQWDNAIAAATVVIDDPNTALMTERFGARVGNDPVPGIPWAEGGDVYWDLFRKGNQNRSSGNTEALWVLQYEYLTPGGADGGYRWETNYVPRTWKIKAEEPDGSSELIIPAPNTYYGGRGAGQEALGDYFYTEIWMENGNDVVDIRNAEHNIIRDLKVLNPESSHHGEWIYEDNVPITLDENRDFFPIVAKIASMGDHPADIWREDLTVFGSISSSGGPANTTHRDDYELRLAETYLIRAEAHLGNDDKESAAADINVIRDRAGAPPVEAENVDIDYILDERARELIFEENRLRTLTRLGLLVTRSNEHNNNFNYADHQNLWPIPSGEIEKNTGAVLEQNPGY